MTETSTYDQIVGLFEEFTTNHTKFVDEKNKSAATRARKAIGEIKKLTTEYRKGSVEAASNL
tara:strand:+ start:8549 stop:8734 length:186 start_codon:yes stop_codon:yes gene_type:complete